MRTSLKYMGTVCRWITSPCMFAQQEGGHALRTCCHPLDEGAVRCALDDIHVAILSILQTHVVDASILAPTWLLCRCRRNHPSEVSTKSSFV